MVRMIGILAVATVLWGSSVAETVAQSGATATTPAVAVGPQYDTTHVYVDAKDFDRFVASLLATFGGTTSKQGCSP